jgi:GTPase SAR1 family protein
MDTNYRRILVIGSKSIGKTSLLSTIVGGDFSKLYIPTSRIESYFDIENKIEFIDTPGIEDYILNG